MADFCKKGILATDRNVVSVMVQSIHKSGPLKPLAPRVASKTRGKPAVKKMASKKVAEKSEPAVKGSAKEVAARKESEDLPKAKYSLFLVNKEKAVRLRDEENLKILLKWNFDQPTTGHVEQLKTLLGGVTQAKLFLMLFNKDFKMHLKAIDAMQTALMENPDSIMANCDLILKWISLRFFETNPSVLLRLLDLSLAIFAHIRDTSESFTDSEMNAFLPYLIMKMGEPKDSVRTQVRSIVHLVTEIMGPGKVFPLILDGLKTNNLCQRTECLRLLEELLDTTGVVATATPGLSLKQIVECVDNRDNNVRNAAMNAVIAAWKNIGDHVFHLIGKDSELFRIGAAHQGGRRQPALDKAILGFDDVRASRKCEPVGEDLAIMQSCNNGEPPVRQSMRRISHSDRTGSLSSQLEPLSSLESYLSEVDRVVHSVASVSQVTAITAIGQLQYLLTEPGMFRFMANRADTVVQAIATQTSLIRSRHLYDVNALDEITELVRTICNFISSLTREPDTCSRVSSEPLKMLLQEFLYLLKDDRMKRLKDIDWVYRSLNYVTFRICVNADPTACFTALCSMLNSALYNPRNQTVELINKCIYKQSELFLRKGPLDFDVVIKALHDFMQEFSPYVDFCDAVKSSIDTMELCIERLVAGARSSVLDHFSLVPNPETSMAISYIVKCVRGLQNNNSQISTASSAYGELPEQGIRRLHTLLKANPEAGKHLDNALKKYDCHAEFFVYYLTMMGHNDRETSEVSSDCTKMHEFTRQVLSELKSYQQTRLWPTEGPASTQQPVAVNAIRTTRQ